MFCAKLKDLKISGECPFSMVVKNKEPGDFKETDDHRARDALPISEEVHGNIASVVPKRKTSKGKVNLHSLGESIRKLVCPEFENLRNAMIRVMKQQSDLTCPAECNADVCQLLEKPEHLVDVMKSYSLQTGIHMDMLKISLGLEVFRDCYEEYSHILGVVGGALHDFLNSFNVLLKQSTPPNPEARRYVDQASVLCLDKDPGLLTVYYFNPHPTTELFFPGIIQAAAAVLYRTQVEVGMDVSGKDAGALQASRRPHLLYSVAVRDARNLTPSPMRTPSSGAISLALLYTTFPFHILLDQDMGLLQMGDGLRRRLGRGRDNQRRPVFQEHFAVVSPEINADFQGILTMLNTQFVLRVKQQGSGTATHSGKVIMNAALSKM